MKVLSLVLSFVVALTSIPAHADSGSRIENRFKKEIVKAVVKIKELPADQQRAAAIRSFDRMANYQFEADSHFHHLGKKNQAQVLESFAPVQKLAAEYSEALKMDSSIDPVKAMQTFGDEAEQASPFLVIGLIAASLGTILLFGVVVSAFVGTTEITGYSM